MLDTEKVEKLSKFLNLLNEFVKFGAMAALALLAVVALAMPNWVKGRLANLDLEIKEVNAGPIKLVAKEAVKAGANTLQIAEALTLAEVQLSVIKTNLQGQATNPNYASAFSETEQSIHRARAALEEQGTSLKTAGKAVGVTSNVPVRGWLYVGYFAENGELKKPSDRISPKDGVRFVGTRVSELILDFDTPVVSDGDDCSKTTIENFVPPDPNSPERQYAILRASREPIRVLATKECEAPGRGKTVYAQVEVPSTRVRFAALSVLSH